MQCVAVGYVSNMYPTVELAISYFSADGGKNWARSHISQLENAATSSLTSATCDAQGQYCVAIGTYTPVNEIYRHYPLTYTSSYGGTNWVPSKTLPIATETIQLKGVACSHNN